MAPDVQVLHHWYRYPKPQKSYFALAVDYIYRQETCRILATNKKGLEQYIMKDGILYYESRIQSELRTEDLDCEVFFDNHEIKQFLPVVLSDSDVFFAYAMHVHHNILPHAGVEMTMKELFRCLDGLGMNWRRSPAETPLRHEITQQDFFT